MATSISELRHHWSLCPNGIGTWYEVIMLSLLYTVKVDIFECINVQITRVFNFEKQQTRENMINIKQ